MLRALFRYALILVIAVVMSSCSGTQAEDSAQAQHNQGNVAFADADYSSALESYAVAEANSQIRQYPITTQAMLTIGKKIMTMPINNWHKLSRLPIAV